jgi:hypothetical protein
MSDKTRVQINYKSGLSMVVEVQEFTVLRNKLNGQKSYEWVDMSPDPLLLGVDDIESIWELRP